MPQAATRYIAALAAGCVFAFGLAPFDFWPAIPLSVALFCGLLVHPASGKGILMGWLYGLGVFGAGASWVYVSIHIYGHAPPPLAGLLTLIFCAGLALLFGAQGYLFRRLLSQASTQLADRSASLVILLGFPAVWVLFEWLRSWLLTGFPWLYAGYGVLDTPMAGWVPITGVYGASLWLTGLGAALATLYWIGSSARKWVALWTLALAFIGGLGQALKEIEWTQPAASAQRVALYQPNIPLEKKWDRRFRMDILRQYQEASAPLYDEVDLLLWPESALPGFRHHLSPYLAAADARATASNTNLILGIPVRAASGQHNSIIALGTGSGEYHKQKLVPFGEYVPLEDWLRGLIQFFDLPMSNFTKGPPVTPRLSADGYSVAPFICYEVVYPDFVTQGSAHANLLVTVSNDSWFGDSIGPLQHLQMARFRALETGRPLLRGTNNGVSAIIDHKGRVITVSEQFVEATVTGSVTPRAGNTPLMLAGSLPIMLACLSLLLGLFLLGFIRSRRQSITQP